ncbi:precorrin-6y C5,15-methyltransferase (decarboxylating) subunit CbiE [Pyxidicoccus fallax]|uniref:Precorrin-6y C5,15-methyltransferase (Decarboxylating) subunit CbiE n=1 Tax=Pyxidicoccus fallax TaxID=394095 RepID=A0A848LBP1_9BACT|nr:precorrin-6y C5,15-methyltransferase (decarboxylating) subunit CbiE [Pyxidicoccus fallax]NMO16460.1 precorrin-6y C5,15-methyltransferase (decarboxylating) subunit CbiE [Pyxidicoccus fallax]NPC79473.1 precorrin-6y C5,15-methyltransferase (decarboxylating) subunit CbiE [Pyxidicoccus fallax]
MKRAAVTVVGVGDDGCAGLSARAANAVAQAQVLVGGERHLAFFPQFTGERIVLKGGLGATLERVAELANEHQVCVLASGDPLFFGIGGLVARKVGADAVEFVPHPSSVQLAFARIGVAWEDAQVLSFHGRPLTGLCSRLRELAKAALLTDGVNTPPVIARHLLAHGQTGFTAWVCERLGNPGERVRPFSLEALSGGEDVDPLNVLVLLRTDPTWRPPPRVPFLLEDAYAKRVPKRGLITKREVRLLSLGLLGLREDSVVWDVGAGSGSVGIEAALLAPAGHVYGVEVDPEGVALCRENALALGADNFSIIEGRAPEALAGLPDPDAVFVGGSKGSMRDILDVAFSRLRPGGRLVANAVTLENVAEAYAGLKELGVEPEVLLVNVARGEPLARYQRYDAHNPIHLFAASKPEQASEENR